MQINVSVTDANNIVCEVTPPQPEIIVIDRGVAGNGIVSIVPVTISTFQYLRITYTNGTVQDVGPLTSTAYTATSPITIVGNTISLATVPIASGGTDATTAAGAIQNLLPSYTGNGGKRLGLNSGATALEWVTDGGGTVTSVSGTGTVNGLTLTGTVTTSGSLTLGGTLNLSSPPTIGNTTPNTGVFTTLNGTTITASTKVATPYVDAVSSAGGALRNASGTAQLQWGGGGGNNLSLDVSTNMNGANAQIDISPTGTGHVHIKPTGSGGVEINPTNVGTMDNMTIGGTTPRSGSFTTVTASTAIGIGSGGTGQTTANAALNALLPTQTGNASKYLQTDGSNATWDAISLSTADITGILPTANGGTGLGGATPYTANGVVYASSTSALATSSAVTWNGTTFGVNSGAAGALLTIGSGGTSLNQYDANTHVFRTGGFSELMRILASGNVGIGTSSPAYKLDVSASANSANVIAVTNTDTNTANYSTQAYFRINVAGNHIGGLKSTAKNLGGLSTSALYLTTAGAYPIAFGVNDSATPSMLLDASGNLGLGFTPNTWYSTFEAFQFGGNGSSLFGRSENNMAAIGSNVYVNAAGNNTYINTNTASYYQQLNGQHQFYTAPSGTAGTSISFTQAMTLDASGNLGIKTTSPSATLDVFNNSTSTTPAARFYVNRNGGTPSSLQGFSIYNNVSGGFVDTTLVAGNTANTYMAFGIHNGTSYSESARIIASGNFGIGTSNPSYKLDVLGSVRLKTGATGTPVIVSTGSDSQGTLRFGSSSNEYSINGGADYLALIFNTNGSERARIDSSGNLLVGTASSLGVIVAKKDQTSDTAITVSNAGTASATTTMSFALNEAGSPQGWFRRYRDGSANTEVGFSDSLLFTGNVTSTKTERARITSSGDFVVADTSSQYSAKLYVNGSIAARNGGVDGTYANAFVAGYTSNYNEKNIIQTAVSSGGSLSGFRFLVSDGAGLATTSKALDLTRSATLFYISNTEAARIDSSGNMGLGRSDPPMRLGLSTSGSVISGTATIGSNMQGIQIYNTNSATQNNAVGLWFSTGPHQAGISSFRPTPSSDWATALAFYTHGGATSNLTDCYERVRIDGDGNLLVGTTSEAGQFTVNGLSANKNVANFICSNTSGSNYILNLQSNASVANTAYLIRGYSNTSTGVFFVAGNGNVTNTNNSYGAISDAKLKENIVDATPKLADMMQIKIRNYNLIGDTTKQLGVVAQELETVFPSMIDEKSDKDTEGNDLGTTTKSVKYSVFVPMLIKAMQEQQAIIESLKARLDAANL